MKTLLRKVCEAAACLLVAFAIVLAVRCYYLRTGTRYHAPVIYHIPTGRITYIDAYGVNQEKPWELADSFSTDGGTFRLPRREDRVWCSSYIWEDLSTCSGGIFLPNRWCYLIMDLYDTENIQCHTVKEGRLDMRDYDLEIEALGGGWIVYIQ